MILKKLEHIASKGYNIGQVFRDWVTLMLTALCRDDDRYMKVMNQYSNEGSKDREADLFAEALAELMAVMKQENEDVLGGIYMQIVSKFSAQGMGQYFTPVPVCDLMSSVTITDDAEEAVTVADPACGSGRMLLSAAKQTHIDSVFHGTDADRVCAQMCALNLVFFNMNGFVIHGNTISMDYFTGWITTRTLTGGTIRRMSEEELKNYKNNYGRALQHESAKRQEGNQLSLI